MAPWLVFAKNDALEIQVARLSATPKEPNTPQAQATGSGAILRGMNRDCQGRIIPQIAPGCHIVTFAPGLRRLSPRIRIRSLGRQRRLLATANASTPAGAGPG